MLVLRANVVCALLGEYEIYQLRGVLCILEYIPTPGCHTLLRFRNSTFGSATEERMLSYFWIFGHFFQRFSRISLHFSWSVLICWLAWFFLGLRVRHVDTLHACVASFFEVAVSLSIRA